jgi:hypothetical protein
MKLRNILIFILLLQGCGHGTGTGNPVQSATAQSIPSAQIFNEICTVIIGCHSEVTRINCSDGILPMTTFASRLGVTIAPPPTFQQIIDLDFAGQLQAHPIAFNQCRDKMAQLTCQDAVVQNSYDPSNASNPFDSASQLLDPICTGVFGGP